MTIDAVFKQPQAIADGDSQQLVSLDTIIPGRWQSRQAFDQVRIEELAESIKISGLLNPLLVFWNEKDQYELIAGERRWRAAQLAGLKAIPVRVLEGTAAQLQVAAVVDNVQRENLSPVEEAAAYELLMQELDVSESELARRLGKSRIYLLHRRLIASAALEIHDALAAGTLSFTLARGIAAGAPGDHASQAVAAREVLGMLDAGQRCTEEMALRRAEQAVLEAHRETLSELGWKIRQPSGAERPSGDSRAERPYIYSHGERPRQWTGAEILEVVRNRTAPDMVPSTTAEQSEIEEVSLEASPAAGPVPTKPHTSDLVRRFGVSCSDCGEPFSGSVMSDVDGRLLCPGCRKSHEAMIAAERNALWDELLELDWTWLDTMPTRLLRLLLMSDSDVRGLPSSSSERIRVLVAKSNAQLRTLASEHIVDLAYKYRLAGIDG